MLACFHSQYAGNSAGLDWEVAGVWSVEMAEEAQPGGIVAEASISVEPAAADVEEA